MERLFDRLVPGDKVAYVVRCACDPEPDGGGGGETVGEHVLLFPLRQDVRWTYRVPGQMIPALQRARVPFRWTEVVVRQSGCADPALRRRKLDRGESILRRISQSPILQRMSSLGPLE